MRRNRSSIKEPLSSSTGKILQPSTPLVLNQNSNSCSNDTICSTLSVNTATTSTTNIQSQIAQDELKIRNFLKDLQTNVKQCQEERNATEPNITAIQKTHEKVKKEEKRK